MKNRKKPVSIIVILAVLFVLFMGARSKQKEEVRYPSDPVALPQYAARGPYLVGTHQYLIGGESQLEIVAWYPAAAKSSQVEAIRYRYNVKMGDPVGHVSLARYDGQALQDAPYDLSDGPYPLVILSPGFSIGASAYGWLAEHLASYGFVVLGSEHQEVLDPEAQLWSSAVTRPQDILTVFAYVDQQVESAGDFEGLIDNQLAAVIGHSYGGYTALMAAGAQINTIGFESHCESAYELNDPTDWLCDMILPHLPDMASLAGLESVPPGLWPSWADPRVDAIVSMAGDAFFFGTEGLANISVPVMAIGGTLDEDSPYQWSGQPTFEYVSSPRKVLIGLTEAEHMIFTGVCEKVPLYMKFFSGEFCEDQYWDRAYAHGLVKHFATAFLLTELQGDPGSSAALSSEAAQFFGMTFDALGYE